MNDVRLSAYVHYCFTEEENALLFMNCPVVKKDKHEFLFKVDDIVRTVYYLKKGEVKFFLPLPDGSSRTFSHQREGSIVGLVNSFSDFPSASFCEAVKPCEFLSCPINVFWERLQKYGLTFKYISLEAKKAYFLQVKHALGDTREFVRLVLEEGLTQQEIADIMGYSRVQISRICSQLKKGKTPKRVKYHCQDKGGE
jgi:CRP-like cAMP-binding protein